MRRQPPLLDPSGKELPSPLFTPRPGWGGQLKVWFRKNLSVLAFRGILVAAMTVVLISVLRRPAQITAPVETPVPTPLQEESYEETADAQDTLTAVSQRALERYLKATDTELDAVQHLWATDRLANAMLSAGVTAELEAGQLLRFPLTVIEYAINEAQTLSPSQRASLQKYLK